jgi:hypothetical protein
MFPTLICNFEHTPYLGLKSGHQTKVEKCFKGKRPTVGQQEKACIMLFLQITLVCGGHA